MGVPEGSDLFQCRPTGGPPGREERRQGLTAGPRVLARRLGENRRCCSAYRRVRRSQEELPRRFEDPVVVRRQTVQGTEERGTEHGALGPERAEQCGDRLLSGLFGQEAGGEGGQRVVRMSERGLEEQYRFLLARGLPVVGQDVGF